MRVLAVAQAFKETLDLDEVIEAFSSGIAAAGGQALVIGASDGGDGLLQALRPVLRRATRHSITGPLGLPVSAEVGWLDAETAVVESRLVCGLGLVPLASRNPARTTTRGLGELIDQLSAEGARDVYVGLGGSATMDGGTGMGRAWGWSLTGADGTELAEGGGALTDLRILRHGRRPVARIRGLVDVRNELTGPGGARVFAEQKGASPEVAQQLEHGLDRLVEVTGARDFARHTGAGAAGGLGFGILFFAGGSLLAGAPWVLGRLGFEAALRESDLLICGEGAFDATSLEGKLTGTVLAAARRAGVPAGLIAPSISVVPEGVMVESGGGRWSARDLSTRTARLVKRALSTRADV